MPQQFQRKASMALAAVVLFIAIAASVPMGYAATADAIVTGNLLGATSLDVTGCATDTPNVTSFNVIAGQNTTTSADCVVSFGSTSNTSMLHMFQADGAGTAMYAPGDTTLTQLGGGGGHWVDMDAADANNAIVIGWCQIPKYTSDGGVTWNDSSSPPADTCLFAVESGTATTSFAAGYDGAGQGGIYKTTNGGATWTDLGGQPTMTETNPFIDVYASSATVVFALSWGGNVWKSTDGGTTWAQMTTPPGNAGLSSIACASATNVWAAGNGALSYFSSNGGSSWTQTATPGGNILDLDAVGATTAFAASSGTVQKTTDGTTWTDTQVWAKIADAKKNFTTIDAVDANTVYAADLFGKVVKTSDAGVNWSNRDLDFPDAFYGIAAPTTSTVFAAGESLLMYKSTDSGVSWTRQLAQPGTVTDVDAVGPSVYASGTVGMVQVSTNAGQSWTNRTASTGTSEHLWDVAQFNTTTPVAVGNSGTIIRSTNSGVGWVSLNSGTTASLRGIAAVNGTSVGWIVGANGTVLKTVDAGVSWSAQTSGVTQTLNEVVGVTAQVAYAAGNGGTIIKTTNGGTTWSTLTSGVTTNLHGIDAWDTTHAYVSGEEATLLKTTNGTSWSPIATGGNWWEMYMDISVPAAGTIYITDNPWDIIRRSYDDGGTWQNLTSTMPFMAIDTTDVNTVVGGGSNTEFLYSDAGTAIPDYNAVTNNWANATNLFAACLRSVSGSGVNPIWTPQAACTVSDAGHWKAIPAISGPSGKLAESTTSGFNAAIANLRFGMKASPTLAPGEYSVGLGFDVVAPNV